MAVRKRLEPLAQHYDTPEHRSPREIYREMGIVETLTVEKVRWVRPYSSHPRSGLVTIGSRIIHLPAFITDDLGERVLIGVGKYRGQIVLLIKAAEEGYKHGSSNKGNKRHINAPKLIETLLKAGAKRGCYEPVKIRGGWMCERVKT
jgi:hypothetical protein